MMKVALPMVAFVFLVACDQAPKKPATPPLTPELAQQLLNYDHRAELWLQHVRKQNPACSYQLALPDQIPPLTQIDLPHVVVCSNRPAPVEFDAAVTFVYDPDTQKWTLKRFSS